MEAEDGREGSGDSGRDRQGTQDSEQDSETMKTRFYQALDEHYKTKDKKQAMYREDIQRFIEDLQAAKQRKQRGNVSLACSIIICLRMT